MEAKLILCQRYCDTARACARYVSDTEKQNKKITVFCEDRFTLNMETEIAKAHPRRGSFNISVTTFSRYLQRKTGFTPLSKEGSVMAVAMAMFSLEKKLQYLKGGYAKNTAATVYEIIAQLKSSKIKPELLLEYKGADTVLKNKLSDLNLIYSAYGAFLEKGYTDENSYLSLVLSYLNADENIKTGEVVFVGFSSFTRQGAAVIEGALENAAAVTGIFCGGQPEVYTNEAADCFLKACAERGLQPASTAYVHNIGKEQETICRNLFEPSVFKRKQADFTDKVFIYEAADSRDEFFFIAQKILFEIKENKRRYKDIAVICPETEAPALKRVFEKLSIPYFSDIKRPVFGHPLTQFVCSYLKMHESGFSVFETLKFIKNLYFEKDLKLTDAFENFLIEKGAYSGFILKPLTIKDEKDTEFEKLRARAHKLIKLSPRMPAQEYCDLTEQLLEETGAEETTAELLKSPALDGRQDLLVFGNGIVSKITALLSEIRRILGSEVISIREFSQLFESGAKSKTVSLLPAFSDAVYIGGYDFAGIMPEVLFLAGLSHKVPSASLDTGFISDKDIIKLEKFRLKIEPKIQTVNRRARECAGVLAASFSGTLHLSYSANGADGKPQRKSEIITYLQKIFSYGEGMPLSALTAAYFDETDERENLMYHAYRYAGLWSGALNFILDITAFREGARVSAAAASAFYHAAGSGMKQILDGFLKNSGTAVVPQITAGRKLFFGGKALSVSALQSFYECPYRSFLANGLKLSERKTAELLPVDSGNILHAVMERLLSQNISCERDELLKICEEAVAEIAAQGRFGFSKNDAKNEVLLSRLSREAARIVNAAGKHKHATEFNAVHTELSFGFPDSLYPPLMIGETNKYAVHGIVDRADACGNYIRVIDYKSGYVDDKDLTENYYTGIKTQLWLYLNAVSGGKIPAGAYYFDLNDKYVSAEEDIDNYVMVGMTRAESGILKSTDKNLADNMPAVSVKIKPDRKGGLTGQLIADENFENYCAYSKKIAAKAAQYMEDGIIAASPYGTVCERCAYGGVCGFDPADGQIRKVSGISVNTIAYAARGEGEKTEEKDDAACPKSAEKDDAACAKSAEKDDAACPKTAEKDDADFEKSGGEAELSKAALAAKRVCGEKEKEGGAI